MPREADDGQNAAFNFVTLGPRKILIAGGFPEMEDFFTGLGLNCISVSVVELAKAAGGIGCLTGVLWRDPVA